MITPSFSITATERVLPKLALDFTTASLDSRVTFTRTTDATHPATYVNSGGVVTASSNNQARFDYDPVTLACKGLLIEESRTNSIVPSANLEVTRKLTITGLVGSFTDGESVTSTGGGTGKYVAACSTSTLASLKQSTGTFSGTLTGSSSGATATISASGAAWRLSNGTLTENAATAPDGTNTALLLTATSTNCEFYNTASIAASTAYTSTLYVKRKTGTGALQIRNSANNAWLTVTPSTSAWTRIANNGGLSGGTGYCDILITTSGDEFYIWGAQLEAGAFATSYIPTTTTALTRNADVATMTGTNFSDWFNFSEGTYEVQYIRGPAAASGGGRVFASGVGGSNSYGIFIANATSTQDYLYIRDISGDAVAAAVFLAGAIGTTSKFSVAYKVNDFAWASNGASPATDTSGVVPSQSNELRFGRAINTNGSYLNGWISKLTYYPQRLINNEVRAISK